MKAIESMWVPGRALRSVCQAVFVSCLALGFSGGCRSFEAVTPAGFVELEEDDRYDYRATTADGVVVAVRALKHEPKGELSFWVAAIEKELREDNGYALLETRDVTTNQGMSGKQLRFGHDEGKTPHLYFVTLFVTDSKLYLLEAGGKKELMEQQAVRIDTAIAGFCR